jgi:hypothetical protein
MHRLFKLAFALTLICLGAGTAHSQSPAQLRPQFSPSLPPTFTPPSNPAAASPGPAVYPYVAPIGGSFQHGAQFGFVTRQGQAGSTYAGPGYGGILYSTPTNLAGR